MFFVISKFNVKLFEHSLLIKNLSTECFNSLALFFTSGFIGGGIGTMFIKKSFSHFEVVGEFVRVGSKAGHVNRESIGKRENQFYEKKDSSYLELPVNEWC